MYQSITSLFERFHLQYPAENLQGELTQLDSQKPFVGNWWFVAYYNKTTVQSDEWFSHSNVPRTSRQNVHNHKFITIRALGTNLTLPKIYIQTI